MWRTTTLIFTGLQCITGYTQAQEQKLYWGASLPLAARFNVINGENTLRRTLGAWGIDGWLKVKGQNEQAMSLLLSAGILRDARPFRLDVSSVLWAKLYFMQINPTVLIPTHSPRTQWTMGIGCLFNIGHTTSFRTTSNAPLYYSTNIDSAANMLLSNSRSVLPYISAGIMHRISQHIALHATIAPTLLNYYAPGTEVFYETPYAQHNFVMAYQPIYFGIKILYQFRPEEW